MNTEEKIIKQFREKFNLLTVKYDENNKEYYALILPLDIHRDDEYGLGDIEAFLRSTITSIQREAYENGYQAAKKANAFMIETIQRDVVAEIKDKVIKLEWKHEIKTASEPTPEFPDGNGTSEYFAKIGGWNSALNKVLDSLQSPIKEEGEVKNLFASHGTVTHPYGEECKDCAQVQAEYEEVVKSGKIKELLSSTDNKTE